MRLAILVLAGFICSGCVNFQAVSRFARETTELTGVIRKEFSQMQELCVKQAELVIVVAGIQDDGPLKNCQTVKAGEGQLAAVSISVLDEYARALAALADDKSFDLSTDLKGLTRKAQGIAGPQGTPLLDPKQVGAFTHIAGVLADVSTATVRQAAIKRLVAESPELAVCGNLLRSFFVVSTEAPRERGAAPYEMLMTLTSDSVTYVEDALSGPLSKAEPIRTAELLREVRQRKDMLRIRSWGSTDSVPVAIVASIDTWQKALEAFSVDALAPEPEQLYLLLAELREKLLAARDAVQAISN